MHKHRIVPGHIGGQYTSNNVILLTVLEHAEEHKKLYEQYGRWQDKVAWKALEGLIKAEDIHKEVVIESNKSRKWNKISREKLSRSKSGKNHPMYGKHHTDEAKQKIKKNHSNIWLGRKHSEETKQKMKANHKRPLLGTQRSEETKQKISEKIKQYWERKRMDSVG